MFMISFMVVRKYVVDRVRTGTSKGLSCVVILNTRIETSKPDGILGRQLGATVSCLRGGPRAVYVISNKRKCGRPYARTRTVTSCVRTTKVRGSHLVLRSRSGAARRGVGGDGGCVESKTDIKVVAGSFRVFQTVRVAGKRKLGSTRTVATNSGPLCLPGGVLERCLTR